MAEPLRTLRMIRHAAWIGQRYAEPAFQRAFPYYRERRYWEEFLLSIKEQISLLQEF
jgi:Ser/Thr protein kinase RdoA (MazF antagonist)